ncbi:MAG: hypothetical protein ACRENP_19410 [Longimicrobiales bacterium]
MGDTRSGQKVRWQVLQDEVVAFLRDWLPEEAKQAYRVLIREDPENWWRHPHFAGGIIVEHALRANGIDERALGIPDLNAVWPDLLEAAVQNQKEDAASA